MLELQIDVNEKHMKKITKAKTDKVAEMRSHYDFTNSRPNPYASLYAKNPPVVIELSPDVASVFPDSNAVNEALRTLIRLANKLPVPANA